MEKIQQINNIPRSVKNLGFLLAVLLFTAGGVYAVNAALTFSSTSVVSEGALTLTGAGASTWDIGANTLSLQTTNNGAITTGTGLFTVAGIMKLQGSASYLQLNGIAGNPSSVTAGDLWYNTTQKSLRFGSSAGVAGTVGVLTITTADSTAIGNINTEQNFSQNFTLPANALTIGKHLKIHASGYYSTTSGNGSCDSGGNCVTLRLKYGSTTIFSIVGSSLSGSTTNGSWIFDGDVTVRSVGAAGSSVGSGVAFFGGSTNSANMAIGATSTAVTINTTAETALQLSAQWNTAHTSNTITMQSFIVEIID